MGAIIATIEVTGYHRGGSGRCDPWCDPEVRWHWEWSGALVLSEPVPTRGRRGLWTLPKDTAAHVAELEQPASVR